MHHPTVRCSLASLHDSVDSSVETLRGANNNGAFALGCCFTNLSLQTLQRRPGGNAHIDNERPRQNKNRKPTSLYPRASPSRSYGVSKTTRAATYAEFINHFPIAKAPLLFAPRNVRPKNQPNRATTPGNSVRSGGASGLRCSTAEEVAEVAAAHLGWPSISPPGHRARRPLHDGRVWARGQTPLPPQRGRLPQAGVCPTLARR
jgi:hypothetical protein